MVAACDGGRDQFSIESAVNSFYLAVGSLNLLSVICVGCTQESLDTLVHVVLELWERKFGALFDIKPPINLEPSLDRSPTKC